MAEFQINDSDLTGFKGKVAVITGNLLMQTASWFELTVP
jgi:hypothetical protein